VLHASRHAAYAVPRELKGQERDDALAKMLETLSRHGSAGLRADIERYSDEVRDMAREIDDIESLATQLHLPQMSMK
jgi:hypothetical protein